MDVAINHIIHKWIDTPLIMTILSLQMIGMRNDALDDKQETFMHHSSTQTPAAAIPPVTRQSAAVRD